MFAPVILFAYNRPEHLRRTLESLCQCEYANQTPLIIYVDGPRDKDDIEKQQAIFSLVAGLSVFSSLDIRKRHSNLGLTDNIIGGVSEVIEEYGKAIILEDDILVSHEFLSFMNQALDLYQNEKRVWHISGWNFPIQNEQLPTTFFWRTALGWGWATWADRWQHFEREPERLSNEWDQKMIQDFNIYGSFDFWKQVEQNHAKLIHTWAVFWYCTIFENNGLCLNPSRSLTSNVGFDGSGTHGVSREFSAPILSTHKFELQDFPTDYSECREAVNEIIAFNKTNRSNILEHQIKVNASLKRLLKKIVEDSLTVEPYAESVVVIFGTGDLSRLVCKVLKSLSINVSAYFVTQKPELTSIDAIPVLSLGEWNRCSPQIAINCVEGMHRLDIDRLLQAEMPNCKILSWEDL